MRLKCLFIWIVCITTFSTAQNTLIILAEDGERFFLFVDDKQINDSAQTIVEVPKIYDDTCRIKAVFYNKTIPTFSTKVFLEGAGKSISKRDFTYSITKEKGKTKLNFISVNDTQSDTTVKALSPEKRIESIFTALAKQKEELDKLNENYPPPAPCTKNISDSLVKKEMNLLKTEHIELNRMKNVKWFISHSCLCTAQMAALLSIYDYENHKVKLVEFYYDYSTDKEKFLDLIPSFKFQTEKEELKTFYEKKNPK